MEIAIVIALLVSVAVMFCCIYRTYPYFKQYNREDQHSEKALLMNGFSLLASSFLTFFVLNCPKYLLDYFASEEIVAYYGFISMPVFAVSLVAGFFYQPKIVRVASQWKNMDYLSVKNESKKQLLIILLITLLGVVCAYTIGIPVLSWIYATDLSAFRIELIIVVLAGGFYAIAVFFSTILIIIKKKNWILITYVIGSMFSFALCYSLLQDSSLLDASIALMLSLALVAGIVSLRVLIVYRSL
jgi:O-antigen/teichoic acid export membrane protein